MVQCIADGVNTPLNLVVVGPQGSGKGTQAEMLAKRFCIPIVATGQLLRDEIKADTNLGKKVREYSDKGLLVPDDIINEVVKKSLQGKDCRRGFILDGYPRTLSQAQFLEEVTNLLAVFEIHISDNEAVKRLADRRVCECCGTNYNLDTNKSSEEGICDKCGCKLIQRADDRPELVKKRLKLYHEETEIILDFYDSRGLLMKVYGEQQIPKVFADIVSKLKQVMLRVPDY